MVQDVTLDRESMTVRHTLDARYRHTLDSLSAAREEYRLLRGQSTIDVRALRKAAKQVHDLEQLQSVLARELAALRVE